MPAADIYLHPVARAAWIGILATALNLLPIGQLDGGHILYALVGRPAQADLQDLHRGADSAGDSSGGCGGSGRCVLFFLGRRHPAIYDTSDIGEARTRLGWVALIVFLLCFTYAPISTGGL